MQGKQNNHNRGNPQTEDGFIQFANELMEAIIKTKLTGREYQVFLLIIRLTYGYHKKEADISLSTIERFTGIKRSNSPKVLKALEQKHMINRNGSRTSINKHYLEWSIYEDRTADVQSDNQTADKLKGAIQEDSTPAIQEDSTPAIQEDSTLNTIYKYIYKDNI